MAENIRNKEDQAIVNAALIGVLAAQSDVVFYPLGNPTYRPESGLIEMKISHNLQDVLKDLIDHLKVPGVYTATPDNFDDRTLQIGGDVGGEAFRNKLLAAVVLGEGKFLAPEAHAARRQRQSSSRNSGAAR